MIRRSILRSLTVLALPLLLCAAGAVRADAPPPELMRRAEALVRQKPTSSHLLAWAELCRAAGQKVSPDLIDFADNLGSKAESADLQRLLIWRMLPVGAADWPEFRRRCDLLATQYRNDSWLGVFRLYDDAENGQRLAVINDSVIVCGNLPDAFPTVAAERAEMNLLLELGVSDTQAGLLILSNRSYDPLHGLLNLDQALTRQIAAQQSNAPTPVTNARNDLRDRYVSISTQIVERLFALNLGGRSKEAGELRKQLAAVPYLNDPAALRQVMSRLDPKQAWFLLVQPLLSNEIAFVQSPPEISATRPVTTEVRVEAKTKSRQAGMTTYEGAVRVTTGRLMITCDSLAVVGSIDNGTSQLTGAGNVHVRGAAGYYDISADHFTFSADTGVFTFGGSVRLTGRDGVHKFRTCALTAAGDLRDAHSLLDDLKQAHDIPTELALLPEIAKEYSDNELTDQARYLLALNLLRPHLSWHAPFSPIKPTVIVARQMQDSVQSSEAPQWRWQPAGSGEAWMMQDIPAAVKNSVRAATTQSTLPEPVNYYWLLKDPSHPDVARAIHLLGEIAPKGSLGTKAAHWLSDLRCNNTVLTFDILDSYDKGADAPLVMDTRAADSVHFSLYRVRDPKTLLTVAQRIGEDFIYRDYGLEFGGQDLLEQAVDQLAAVRSERQPTTKPAIPDFPRADLVREWNEVAGNLPIVQCEYSNFFEYQEEARDPDSSYFGDDCAAYNGRLEKSYRPEQPAWSTWLTDRIVTVPGALLKEPGAYVLVAEANGQKSCAPLLVDALDMTMRRCRDGVFVIASNPEKNKPSVPAAGARIFAPDMIGSATADSQGAAFAKVFAAGDRPILAAWNGHFAIGGFGRVFYGIYHGPYDWDWEGGGQMMAESDDQAQPALQVYKDQFVAAAYTDRPTYRPGQAVEFKLIVRRMRPATTQTANPTTLPLPTPATNEMLAVANQDGAPVVSAQMGLTPRFREADFDPASNLDLPPAGASVDYEVINPQGRTVESGTLHLSDFGTAAGTIPLQKEEVVGSYSLRVSFDGVDHVIPDVFAVKYYRRANFELKLSGVPQNAKPGQVLNVVANGQYYFGKPLAGGSLNVRVVRSGQWRAIAGEDANLDSAGHATVALTLPEHVAGGTFRVIASLRDESNRTVTQSVALEVKSADDPGHELAGLPRFVPTNSTLHIHTSAPEVVARMTAGKQTTQIRIATEDGAADLTLSAPGWYTVTAGRQRATVFAYGGNDGPLVSDTPPEVTDDWVNLSGESGDGRPEKQLWALVDRRQVEVGGKLRLLVFQPVGGARLLFTFEGRTVVDYAVVKEDAWSPYLVVELPITRRELPNFYLQGEILPDSSSGQLLLEKQAAQMQAEQEDDDPPSYRVDVTDPHPNPGGETLHVRLDVPAKEFRPGEAVDVAMHVTGNDGKPRQAEVSLAAVDQSVYAFGEDRIDQLAHQFSDPHARRTYLSKTWRSSQRPTAPIRQFQMKLQQLQQAAQQSSAEAASANSLSQSLEAFPPVSPAEIDGLKPLSSLAFDRLRTDFRETATWQPQLVTDRSGNLSAHFVLPDSLTAYRLTAVALTKKTEIGTAVGRLKVNLPLAAQLFLPRFAVEKDHLQAVAMVFNNTDQPRSCAIRWEGRGIAIAPENAGGHIDVPPHSSVRATAWLSADAAGEAVITFHADSDAEQRTLPILPLGRDREVNLSGDFSGRKELSLPAGFVARDLSISIGSNDVAQSLDGIGYLVEYPYGCVEQTMSRFLPAVVVRQATRQLPLKLEPGIAKALPDVLALGLQRLYNFQHADGGWGWWKDDATNDGMSIYVVDGLARCQIAGTAVDAMVLEHGCDFLKKRLHDGALSSELTARAWLALALAGRADAAQLAAYVTGLNGDNASAQARCTAALACKAAGRDEAAMRLWTVLRGWQPTKSAPMFSTRDDDWQPQTTIALALKLDAQLAFGEPLDACYDTAHRLLALRQGQRWESTPATAAAIESLTQLLAYVHGNSQVQHLAIDVAGKTALDVKDPADLAKLLHLLHLTTGELPRREALPIVLSAECDHPLTYSVSATGTQREDAMGPIGTDIKMTRVYRTLDDKPLPESIAAGQVIAVHLTVDLAEARDYLLVQDARPADCEYADDQLSGPDAAAAANVEFRDDQVCAFFAHLSAGRHELTYYLRAETAGLSHVLPGFAYPMYEEKIRGETGAGVLHIAPAEAGR